MKNILINFDKCTGCGACELACSLHHTGAVNPKKSRVRIMRNPEQGKFFPIIAGPIAEKECKSKCPVIINEEEYEQCFFCRAVCPTRPFFHDPHNGEPLSCDLCAKCVEFCVTGALSLVS